MPIVKLGCCQQWRDTEDVQFRDCEEGDQGQDVLTYGCPICGEEHKGTVYQGSVAERSDHYGEIRNKADRERRYTEWPDDRTSSTPLEKWKE